MTVSVVIPVYNSAAILPSLMQRLQPVLDGIDPGAEVILVNDGSRDESWAVIQQLAGRYRSIRGINLMRNSGQHNALLCGIRAAQREIVVTIDDDLQNPPEEIPRLLVALGEQCDVVYGRPATEQHGLLRDLASYITKLALASAMGVATARHVSAFRAFRTTLRQAFAAFRGPFVSIDVLLTWGTTRFTAVTVRHERRASGASTYTVGRLIAHALNMMTGFSVRPLQAASILGFVFTLFGGGVLLFTLLRYWLSGGGIPGFPFLASIISIFAGAQLFALGIIGEYLARMHFRMMDRLPYTVRERTAAAAPSDGAATRDPVDPC